MSDAVVTEALRLEDTVPAGLVQHRLALGVQWMDALNKVAVGAAGGWTSDLQRIGARPCPQRLDLHPQGRHALRNAGYLARVLKAAADDKVATPPATIEADPTNFVLQAYGNTSLRSPAYATGSDPRLYVPRRLSLTPVQTAGVPATGLENIRSAALWPGMAYPLPAHSTVLRGHVRRVTAPAAPLSVAWARIIATQAQAGLPNFASEPQLGYAHGDDRGEFQLVVDAAAVPGGAALPASLNLRLWFFLPPTDSYDPADPLASLPLEVAGTARDNAVLRGTAVPAGYVMRGPIDLVVPPGATFLIAEALLLFV